MRDLFWLSDQAWAALDPHLPHNQPGKPRVASAGDQRHPSHSEDGWTLARCAARIWTGEDHLRSIHALGPEGESGNTSLPRSPLPGQSLRSLRSTVQT